MPSSDFSPEYQQQKTESKIVASLDRIAHAFRVLLWQESKKYDLSPIQIQILIFLRFHPPDQCTVSYLADEFILTKATISDSIKILEQKGLISRAYNLSDRRSHMIYLTEKGKALTSQLSLFSQKIHSVVKALPQKEKENMLLSLLHIIHQLHKKNVITLQRMCFTCKHYFTKEGQHYCQLMEKQLHPSELRLDCPDHISQK